MALSLAVGLSLHALAMMPSHLPTLPSSRPSYGLVGADGRSARAASEEREDGEHVAHPYTASQSRVDDLTRVHLVHYHDSGGNDAHMLGEPTGASQDRDAEMEHGLAEARAVVSGQARSLGKAAHRTRPVVMITEDEHKQVVEQMKQEREQVAEQLVEVTIKYDLLLAVFYLLSGALWLGVRAYPDANLEAEAYMFLSAYMLMAPRLFDVYKGRPPDYLEKAMVKSKWNPPLALLWMGCAILSAADKIAAQP